MAEGTRMQQRRATQAVWAASTYVLAAGELGVTTDTGVIKIGDGANVWNDLSPAFNSQYLPLLGTAANSNLLGGISSSGFVLAADATTAPTANKVAKRTSDGRLQASVGVSGSDLVNFTQITAFGEDAKKSVITRTITADTTLQLSDVGKMVAVDGANHSPSFVFTVPTNATLPIPIGSAVEFSTINRTGVVLTPASGVTIAGTTIVYGSGSYARLLKVNTDAWRVVSASYGPAPVLRRKIKDGSDNTLVSGTFTKLRMDGANSGTALYSNNADNMGTNQQWSGTDAYKAVCRRSGWYRVGVQIALVESGVGRFYITPRVNGVQQDFGSGSARGSQAENTVRTEVMIPLNLNDYVEIWGFQDAGASATIANSSYASSFFEWVWQSPL